MLYILTGTNTAEKRTFVEALAKKQKAHVEWLSAENLSIDTLLASDMFSPSKVFVVDGGFGHLAEQWQILADSSNHVVCIEPSLDKRKKTSQEVLKAKNVTVKDFSVPQGKDLDNWIAHFLKEKKTNIEPQAKQLLLGRLGFDGKLEGQEELAAWQQLSSELEKLATYAGDKPITKAAVDELVHTESLVDALDIVNALADKQAKRLTQLLEDFFALSGTSDEKAQVIQLTALVAEQFRSIALIQAADKERMPDEEILSSLGWKSGRLFVVRKISRSFAPAVVQSTLRKLENLDLELKTTSTPPRVLLDLIFAGLLSGK